MRARVQMSSFERAVLIVAAHPLTLRTFARISGRARMVCACGDCYQNVKSCFAADN